MGSSKIRQVINHMWLELKKLVNYIVRDFGVLLLDMISVNLAYFLALMIRYSVKWSFRPFVLETILPAFEQFAPWYTICSIIVFMIFRLYGGLWRYAGFNDFNRIIMASICTAAIQVVGSALFVYRMPISYYVLGAGFQFVFTVAIRFGHRIIEAEIQHTANRKLPVVESIIVGMGEIGIQVIKQIEANNGIKIVVIVDNWQPQAIVTHHGSDVNIDHAITGKATVAASKKFRSKAETPQLRLLLLCETAGATEWALDASRQLFVPNYFVIIGQEGLEQKVKAHEMYAGVMRPFPHPQCYEVYQGLEKRCCYRKSEGC